MRIVFFNRFFHPDTSATSQVLTDLASDLAACGAEVHVVTGRLEGTATEELAHGVHVHRVAAASPADHGLAARAWAYGSYHRAARRATARLVSRGDVAVLKTDPPLLASTLTGPLRSRGARVVLWLQDLFPEVAAAYGVPGLGGPVRRWLVRTRDRALREADAVVAISEAMAARIGGAVPRPRLHVIPDWADGTAIRPRPPSAALRESWRVRGGLVVAYCGNFGRVHEFDTILDAARRLRARADVAFVLAGRGPRLAETRARAERERLDNVRFEPHQPRERLGEMLSSADVHLNVLDPRFEGLVFPSKLYGVMAAARPTLFVGDVGGETARVLADTGSGWSIASGDGAALAEAILRLHADRPERERLGANARRAFESRYDRPIALARWREILGL